MAIKLAKSLQSNLPEDGKGFSLVFADKTEYNLDQLIREHNFADGSTPLVLEVKTSLAEDAINEMKEHLNYNIRTSLGTQEMTNKVYNAIKAVFRQYGYQYNSVTNEFYLDLVHNSSIPIEAYTDLNRRINVILKSIFNENEVAYTIDFDENPKINTYTINYTFTMTNELKGEFALYYDKFIEKYREKLAVSEGGLAIDSLNAIRHVTKNDFSTYLLNGEPSSDGNQDYSSYVTTDKSVHVIWEDGDGANAAVDEREQEEIPTSIYDIIEDMQEAIEVFGRIDDGRIGKLQFEDIELNSTHLSQDLDVADDEHYDIIDKHVMLLDED